MKKDSFTSFIVRKILKLKRKGMLQIKDGWYTKDDLKTLIKQQKRGSEITDITGQEVFEGDKIQYFWGNKVTGKKFEGVVFFEKGKFFADKNRYLGVADQIEIVREDIKFEQIEAEIKKWRNTRKRTGRFNKKFSKELGKLGVEITFLKEGIRWRKVD